jgi:hypothetical protein
VDDPGHPGAPDRQHPFGHGKAEYFSSGFEGILIFGAAFASSGRPSNACRPQPIESPGWGLAWSAAATGINFAVARVLAQAGERFNSIALRADSRHLMTDVWTSFGVIAGVALVAWTGWLRLDPLIAIVVGLNITREAWHLMRESVDGLMDRSLDREPSPGRGGARGFKPRGVAFEGCAPGAPAPPPSCRWWCGCRATGRCATATPCSTRSRPRWWPSCPASKSPPTWNHALIFPHHIPLAS